MKRIVLMALVAVGIVGSASAQRDDLYFVPKKKKVVEQVVEPEESTQQVEEKVLSVATVPAKQLEIDEDAYNRRGSYLTDEGDAVSEFAMNDDGFVLITEEGDTMWMNTDTLRLTRVTDGEGWVNGFDGSDSDHEYAMRIIRFRNPRYAIPVSSPLYWDVVYGGSLWPSWEWNIYDDGMYAYVFPTRSNWYYWDYRMSYSYGWNYHWGYPYSPHWGSHWGYYSGYHYGHVWYDPWFNPYFYDYHPGWHHGHHHHAHYPHFGAGKPGWGGGGPTAFPNHRTSAAASTRRESLPGGAVASASTPRTGTSSSRVDGGTERSSSVRVVTGRTGATVGTGTVRSSSGVRSGVSDEVVRRSTGSSSVSRSSSSSSRGGYSSGSSSMSRSSGSTSSYSRPSSTRSTSSSSVSRGSSRSGSSYSSGSSSSSRSSYSGSSSYSSGSSHSSYSGGSSYSSGGSRSGGSYGGGSSSSRSGGSGRR